MAKATVTIGISEELNDVLKSFLKIVKNQNDRIDELEEVIKFYGLSINHLEINVKRLSETQTIPPYIITKPWTVTNESK